MEPVELLAVPGQEEYSAVLGHFYIPNDAEPEVRALLDSLGVMSVRGGRPGHDHVRVAADPERGAGGVTVQILAIDVEIFFQTLEEMRDLADGVGKLGAAEEIGQEERPARERERPVLRVLVVEEPDRGDSHPVRRHAGASRAGDEEPRPALSHRPRGELRRAAQPEDDLLESSLEIPAPHHLDGNAAALRQLQGLSLGLRGADRRPTDPLELATYGFEEQHVRRVFEVKPDRTLSHRPPPIPGLPRVTPFEAPEFA